MKTRFSPLVKLKKTACKKSEQFLQKANANLLNANSALENSYTFLQDIEAPKSGTIKEMLASRTLLNSQREVINHNKGWVNFAVNQVQEAKKQLKLDMIEHEKFQYLELQEIKIEMKNRKVKEAKDLDEVALMTYMRKNQ